jgi:hypothetical protein
MRSSGMPTFAAALRALSSRGAQVKMAEAAEERSWCSSSSGE